jgi:hypothetical protein
VGYLYQKRMKEGLVAHFENNNEEHLKIRNQKVLCQDRKALLKLALLSISESIRNDPEKYSSLIFIICLRLQQEIIAAGITILTRCMDNSNTSQGEL